MSITPEQNRTCFYCKLPVVETSHVLFRIDECAVPVCLACDDKLYSMADRDEEYTSQK